LNFNLGDDTNFTEKDRIKKEIEKYNKYIEKVIKK